MAQTNVDPFAAMGGGVQVGGGWLPKNHPAAQQQAGAQAVQAGQGGSPSAPAPPVASPGSIQGAYQQALQGLLTGPTPQQAGQQVASSAPVSAYRDVLRGNEARDRAFLAERAAAGGFSGSGGFESGVLGLRQAANRDLGGFAGQYASQAEAGRREELLRALALAQGMGDTASAQQLQRELESGRIGLGRDQLGLSYAQLQNQMNQAALAALFG